MLSFSQGWLLVLKVRKFMMEFVSLVISLHKLIEILLILYIIQ